MKARDIKHCYRIIRGGSNREQASQTPCIHKKGGTAGDGDREGLGWPPQELALLFVLLENQSTTIPPLLHKARDKRKKGRKQHQRNKDPNKREKLNNMLRRCPLTKNKSNKAPNQKASHLFRPSHIHYDTTPFLAYNITNNNQTTKKINHNLRLTTRKYKGHNETNVWSTLLRGKQPPNPAQGFKWQINN